ncbi:family 16 glycosylhydrolase [Microbulbifer magnicolonia]|uniref:family 16 glycosylhydrolase n=1 Tax=Microbulbifer magnicolonia TaxID=3109744 RepID=UPI002B418158|nr:family 16 glycosylhydrolase [Microbulbifer sp. GG15]
MRRLKKTWSVCTVAAALAGAAAASAVAPPAAAASPVVWAVNSGGEAFVSMDGIAYGADGNFSGGGARQLSGEIRASHNPVLYQSERRGERFAYARALPDGRYNLTLRFAESTAHNAGERTFSVAVEGRERIAALDVRAASGAINTAYDVTIPDVQVADGELNIDFRGINGAAAVSALVVTQPRQRSEGWQRYWSDEFDYSGAPDPAKWNYEIQPPGWVNDELQRYTDRRENLRVEGGVLIVEGRRDHYMGSEYSSGRIHSQGKGDLLYGRVEVRAKLPAGRGTWPAIWMMPADHLGYGDGWPDSGEIDIMEHVGYDAGQVHATIHNNAYYWVNGRQRKGSVMLDDVTEAFHVYAMEWDRGRMDFYIDDIHYFTYINDRRGWKSWPFDRPFYVILNLAIGGNWGGARGVDADIWPRRMEVDYVRMYRRRPPAVAGASGGD